MKIWLTAESRQPLMKCFLSRSFPREDQHDPR
jgi:hypothetical protein